MTAHALPAVSDSSSRVVVEHLPPWIESLPDLGPVGGSTVLKHLCLVVARPPEREAAFERLLRDLYDRASSDYHHWQTPQELGDTYGASQEVLDSLSDWLKSEGLEVESISNDRTVIYFSGKIDLLSAAFSTSFHYFDLNGDRVISLIAEPLVPSRFQSAIRFIAGLSTVRLWPAGGSVTPTPEYTSSSSEHFVSPADFARIYNIDPVSASGTNGAGRTIAVVGFAIPSNSDIEEFEQLAGLPSKDPEVQTPTTNPGPANFASTSDDYIEYLKEATADVERATSVAPGATVLLDVTDAPSVMSSNPSIPDITDLLNIPIADVIDNNRASILTMSFHECEGDAGMPQVLFADSLFQQAAAEGISVFVSAGDSGADDCLTHGIALTNMPSSGTLDTNYLCSSSYVTCVGGTEFNDTNDPCLTLAVDPCQFWSATNLGDLLSATGYIPEGAWNESTTTNLIAGGGGTSQWIPQPSWQTGTGVPLSGFRNIPDVAFTASVHDAYFFCYAGKCTQDTNTGFYGTSGATPSMAGIMALVNQTLGDRQGNFNPTLYALAATPSNGVFNDVTVASSGVTDCSVDTPSMCDDSITLASGSNPPVLSGFTVNTGYDQVTGWGSINVANLVAALTTQPTPAASSTTLSLSSTSISTTQTTTVTVEVSGSVGTPTGTVQIMANGKPYTPVLVPALDFGQVVLPGLSFATPGTYTLTAVYSGDAKYAGSTSTPVTLDSSAPSFELNISPTSMTISTPGGTATGTLTASTTNGYAGTLTVSCSVTADDAFQSGVLPTCSLGSGSAVMLTSTSPFATLPLTINTTALSARTIGTPFESGHYRGNGPIFVSLCVLFFLPFSLQDSRRFRRCCGRIALLWIFVTCLGCNHKSGTPTGAYVVTVTATGGGITAATKLDLLIQ